MSSEKIETWSRCSSILKNIYMNVFHKNNLLEDIQSSYETNITWRSFLKLCDVDDWKLAICF